MTLDEAVAAISARGVKIAHRPNRFHVYRQEEGGWLNLLGVVTHDGTNVSQDRYDRVMGVISGAS